MISSPPLSQRKLLSDFGISDFNFLTLIMMKKNKEISLFTEEEEIYLGKLIIDSKNRLISDFYDKALPLIQLCEDRKNRIRYNKVTDEDIENGFTPENFPYLTTLSKKYYPEKYWRELQKMRRNNNFVAINNLIKREVKMIKSNYDKNNLLKNTMDWTYPKFWYRQK